MQGCQIKLTFPILVGVLESLHQAEGLVHRAAHGQVVDSDLPQDALIVDHKQPSVRGRSGLARRTRSGCADRMRARYSPVGDALVLLQHAVVAGDGMGQVGQQRDVHGSQASLLPWGVDPNRRQEKKFLD